VFADPWLTKYAVRSMMSKAAAASVNVAIGDRLHRLQRPVVYGATKASMIGFTRSLAARGRQDGRDRERRRAPVSIDTDMTQGLGEDGREQVKRRSALRRLRTSMTWPTRSSSCSATRQEHTGTVLTVDAGNTLSGRLA